MAVQVGLVEIVTTTLGLELVIWQVWCRDHLCRSVVPVSHPRPTIVSPDHPLHRCFAAEIAMTRGDAGRFERPPTEMGEIPIARLRFDEAGVSGLLQCEFRVMD